MKHFYGDFDEVSRENVLDVGGEAIYIRHKCGLEVLHIKCEDKERLFAFVFRTPAMNDLGAAHIMEHTVLCGSKRYPIREPFVNLMNQSVNTYLNAMTYPDMTVYPSASVNLKDYYNLMSVYADAVFFPLLTENAFMQEAHRVEVTDGEASIQGVVYNEMKALYSSFASVSSNIQTASLMEGTCYAHESGGDPLSIAGLTYEEFIDFHKKYYKMSNCLVVFYGDEQTEKQLDFLQKEVIDRFPAELKGSVSWTGEKPIVDEWMMRMMKSSPLEKPITVRKTGPDGDAGGAAVTISWRVTKAGGVRKIEDIVRATFLYQLLAGNDTSPINKALDESEAGDHLLCSMGNGTMDCTITFGLGGVAEGGEQKVWDIIEDTLQDVSNKGFKKNEIEAAEIAIDISLREKVRASDGPFSLVLMELSASDWVYGNNPTHVLNRREVFEAFKKELKAAESQSDFCVNILRDLLLDNSDKAFVVVSPSASYMKEREEKEASLTRELSCKADMPSLLKRLDVLHKAQERKESAREKACIPRVKAADLSSTLEAIDVEVSDIDGIPLIKSVSPTNGIVYLSTLFPVDTLPLDDMKYLSVLGDCAFFTGGGGMGWEECLSRLAVCTGSVFASPVTSTLWESAEGKAYTQGWEKYNFLGRDWIKMGFKCPVEKIDEALPLFRAILLDMDFSDEKRLKTIITDNYDSMRSSVIPSGSQLASMRARCRMARENALDEVWNGLTRLFVLRRLTKEPMNETGERLSAIMKRIIEGGVLFHVTADDESMKRVISLLPCLSRELRPLVPRLEADNELLYDLTYLDGEKAGWKEATYTLKSQVGFAAICAQTGGMTAERMASSNALCHWMACTLLWERIRTKGGAYGAYGMVKARTGIASFSTYRDPSPLRSLQTIRECLEQAAKMRWRKEDVERMITSGYSEYVEPLSPIGYGVQGLVNTLYGVTYADRTNALKALLAINSDSLHNEAVRIRDAIKESGVSSVICNGGGEDEIDLGL